MDNTSARLNRINPSLQGPVVENNSPIGPLPKNITKPHIEKALLAYLQTEFPVTVSPNYSIRDYDRMAGQQQILQHLHRLLIEQEGQ